ncbi:hypothetical protein QOT17_014950 [Balamuthia mandrillaris]
MPELWGVASSTRLCGFDTSSGVCSWNEYLTTLFLLLIPGLAVALITTICAVSYYLCCRCRVGIRTKATRNALLATAIFIAVQLMIIIAVSSWIQHSTDTYFADTSDYFDRWVSKAMSGIQETENLPFEEEITAANDDWDREAMQALQEVKAELDNSKKAAEYAAIITFSVMIVILALMLIITLLAIVGIFYRRYWAVFGFGIVLMVFVVPTCLLLSYGIIAETLVVDACQACHVEMGELREGISRSRPNSGLDALIPCPEKGWSVWQARLEHSLRRIRESSCELYETVCDGARGGGRCPPLESCTMPAILRLTNETVRDVVACGSRDCPRSMRQGCRGQCVNQRLTVAECAEDCVNSDMRTVARLGLATAESLNKYDTLLRETVIPLLNCEYKGEYCHEVEATLCGDMSWLGILGVLALLLLATEVVGIVVAGVAAKTMTAKKKAAQDKVVSKGFDDVMESFDSFTLSSDDEEDVF